VDWISLLIAIAFGGALGFVAHLLMSRYQSQSQERRAAAKMAEAERVTKGMRREAEIQAKQDMIRLREGFEQETQKRRSELDELESGLRKRDNLLTQRDENFDRKASILEKKEQTVDTKLADLTTRQADVEKREGVATKTLNDANARLQKLATMTREEARKDLFTRTEREVRTELGGLVRRLQEEAQASAAQEAANVVAMAMHRYAASHDCETMTSSIPISGERLKGAVIGREGRNIRTLETLTGVTILVDETPDAVMISSFDPVRREVARRSLEILVADGRIHATRIEEVVASVQADMDKTMREVGEQTLALVNMSHIDPELAKMLGRLKFRTSYSQNVLVHSREVSALTGMMAAEIGLNSDIGKRVGLLHDIGKAMDHDAEGSHAVIGAEFLKKFNLPEEIISGVATHYDIANASIYGVLCSTADMLSSMRPGARMEPAEIFIHRMEKIEDIANSFKGVHKSFAVQAGREVRVIVDPEAMTDGEAVVLARNIAKRFEEELKYPGQIRVVVTREKRCVEFAR